MDVDVRIIVASNENLQEAYKKGKFREDLYHRFNEFSIQLPSLRERKSDISLFADFFQDKTNKELNKNIEGYELDVMESFLNYKWPGNLREFRNVVRRAVLLTPSVKINLKVLPWEITNNDFQNSQATISSGTQINSQIKKGTDLKNAAAKAEYEDNYECIKGGKF